MPDVGEASKAKASCWHELKKFMRVSLERHTSGRYDKTGSLHSNLFFSTSFMVGTDSHVFICSLASSCQAVIRLLLASSPSPKSVDIATSERGSLWGVGNENTQRESASLVKPCCLTKGTASCSNLLLEVAIRRGEFSRRPSVYLYATRVNFRNLKWL